MLYNIFCRNFKVANVRVATSGASCALGLVLVCSMLAGSSLSTLSAQSTAELIPALLTPPREPVHDERYSIPEFCLGRVAQADTRERRGKRMDTLPYNPEAQLSASVVAKAKQCLVSMPAATYDISAAKIIRWLARIVRDEGAYKTILKRQLVDAKPDDLLTLWQAAIQDLLWEVPSNSALASDIISSTADFIDSTQRVSAQLLGYRILMQYASMQQDSVSMDAALSHVQNLEARRFEDQKDMENNLLHHGITQIDIYTALASIKGPREGAATYIAYMDSVAHLLKYITEDGLAYLGMPLLGSRFPALKGQFRFPASEASLAESGQVNLLVFVDANCEGVCSPSYSILRRLQQKYPDLRVMLVARIAGTIRYRTPTSVENQAEQLRDYFIDSLALAKSIAVDTATFTKLPGLDGRRVYNESELEVALRPVHPQVLLPGSEIAASPVSYVLVDRRGIVAGQGMIQPTSEQFLLAYIRRLLAD